MLIMIRYIVIENKIDSHLWSIVHYLHISSLLFLHSCSDISLLIFSSKKDANRCIVPIRHLLSLTFVALGITAQDGSC